MIPLNNLIQFVDRPLQLFLFFRHSQPNLVHPSQTIPIIPPIFLLSQLQYRCSLLQPHLNFSQMLQIFLLRRHTHTRIKN